MQGSRRSTPPPGAGPVANIEGRGQAAARVRAAHRQTERFVGQAGGRRRAPRRAAARTGAATSRGVVDGRLCAQVLHEFGLLARPRRWRRPALPARAAYWTAIAADPDRSRLRPTGSARAGPGRRVTSTAAVPASPSAVAGGRRRSRPSAGPRRSRSRSSRPRQRTRRRTARSRPAVRASSVPAETTACAVRSRRARRRARGRSRRCRRQSVPGTTSAGGTPWTAGRRSGEDWPTRRQPACPDEPCTSDHRVSAGASAVGAGTSISAAAGSRSPSDGDGAHGPPSCADVEPPGARGRRLGHAAAASDAGDGVRRTVLRALTGVVPTPLLSGRRGTAGGGTAAARSRRRRPAARSAPEISDFPSASVSRTSSLSR